MGKGEVKGSYSCSKPPPAHMHFPLGCGNSFQGDVRVPRTLPRQALLQAPSDTAAAAPSARPRPPLLVCSPACKPLPAAASKAPEPPAQAGSPRHRGRPCSGGGSWGTLHPFCINFPSLFSLLFTVFVQSKPSPDLAIEKNNELGPASPAGSPPFGRQQLRIRCLDSGEGPRQAQTSYLLPQPG